MDEAGLPDWIQAKDVRRMLVVTRQRVGQLRNAGQFGEDGCKFDRRRRAWLYRKEMVQRLRQWREEEWDTLLNPWPPWTKRDPMKGMPPAAERLRNTMTTNVSPTREEIDTYYALRAQDQAEAARVTEAGGAAPQDPHGSGVEHPREGLRDG